MKARTARFMQESMFKNICYEWKRIQVSLNLNAMSVRTKCLGYRGVSRSWQYLSRKPSLCAHQPVPSKKSKWWTRSWGVLPDGQRQLIAAERYRKYYAVHHEMIAFVASWRGKTIIRHHASYNMTWLWVDWCWSSYIRKNLTCEPKINPVKTQLIKSKWNKPLVEISTYWASWALWTA